jgi:outer membrane protein assembly factor BamB
MLVGVGLTVGEQHLRADWPQWRGPNRDGVVGSFSEPASWPDGLVQRWKIEIGLGYSTPLVVGDRLYVFSRQGEDEVMSALDAASGRLIWREAYPASVNLRGSAAAHGPGPKSTPVLADGRLHAIGMTGIVTTFDAQTGRRLWQTPGSNVLPLYRNHAFSPLVDRGLVVFHVGGHDQGALTAFDAATGEVRWRWAGDGPGYGSPILADLGGTRQIVTFTQRKLVGVDAGTGALLWERPYTPPTVTNSITPVLFGQMVIVSSTEQPVTAFTVARSGSEWVTKNVWENTDVSYRMSNAVVAGDVLFSLSTRNSGQYFGVDARTGKTLWTSEGRQAMNAAIARSGTLLFVLEDDGELVIVRSNQTGFTPVRRYKVADSATWAQPAISGNRIFVKDVSTLALWTLD